MSRLEEVLRLFLLKLKHPLKRTLRSLSVLWNRTMAGSSSGRMGRIVTGSPSVVFHSRTY